MSAAGTSRDPATVGPYRLVSKLGEGGMGVVHLGLDPAGRAVAVKVLRAHVAGDPDARRRLAREVATLRRVRHPRVATVIDADVDGELPYLVTHFVPGRPLDAHVKETGPLARGHVARVGSVLADALRAIHQVGVVHRDVKPANVMLLDGDPVLIDFGIAHVADESRITITGLVMGTPGYLSPEILGGDQVTAATDWWGWGATLAFAATGRPPFGTGPVEVVLDRVRRGMSDLSGLDPGLRATLTAALSVDPGRRPPPQELIAGLTAASPRPAAPRVNGATVRRPPPGAGAPTVVTPPPRGDERTVVTPPPSWHDATVVTPPPAAPAAVPPAVPPAGPPAAPPARDLSHLPPPPANYRPPGPPAPVRAPDTGVLLGVLGALSAVAAVAPYGAVWLSGLLMVLARVVDRSSTAMLRRRQVNNGPRGTDAMVTMLALPWRVLLSAAGTLAALVLPILVGICVVFIGATAQAGSGSPVPNSPAPLALGMAALLLTAWYGPGGDSVRYGSRRLARAAARGPQSRLAVWIVLGLVVVAVLLVLSGGGQPDWGPWRDTWLVGRLTNP